MIKIINKPKFNHIIIYFELVFCLSVLAQSSDKPVKKANTNIVKGFIRDEANGETLSYVNVVLEGTTRGAMSSENGYYIIDRIPDGQYTLKAMMIGYKIAEQSINLYDGQTLTTNFNLTEQAIQGETIVKTAKREQFDRQIEMSKIHISRREIEAVPAFVESDLFRSLQLLPGIVTQSDFSSALYIRGGNPSENMILLDDVRIYNPYHFGGVFSTFNTDAIKNVDVSLGGFPARYGNAISSVISITNKDGNSKKYQGSGSISLLSSKLLLEGPIPNGSFLISGRRTYFDFLYNHFIQPNPEEDSDRFPYYFYDFHGKINYAFSDNNKLTLSGFYGDDIVYFKDDREEWDNQIQAERVVGQDETDIRFGNFSTTLKWQYIFNPRLFSEFVMAKSRFRVNLLGDYGDEESLYANDVINDYTIRADMTYFHSDKHEILFGLDYQQLDFSILMDVNQTKLIDYTKNAHLYSSYLQDDWKISNLFNVQSGLRVTYYDLGNYIRFDPRLSCRYRLRHNLNLKASFGGYNQYFYTFNPEDIDFLNYIRLIDLWFPIDERYNPIQAFHYIGGFEYLLSDDYMFSVEGYYKDYHHLLDLNELGDKGEQDDFLQGYGQAAGVELMLRKQTGNITGWLTYALAFTERSIELPRASYFLGNPNIEKEYQTYPPSYDRRHTFTVVANYQVSERWNLSTRFTYASGLPETPTIGWKYLYSLEDDPNHVTGDLAPVKAPKNSQRFPAYIRWDISATRTYQFKHWSIQPFIQIINLTNHKNIFLYNYDLEAELDSNGNLLTAKREGIPMFPIVPTVGINFNF